MSLKRNLMALRELLDQLRDRHAVLAANPATKPLADAVAISADARGKPVDKPVEPDPDDEKVTRDG